MLRHIREYERFDLEGFLHYMELMVTNIAPWEDYTTKARLGTKVEVVITKDDTPYHPGADGSVQTNLFEKLVFKIRKNEVAVKVGDIVIPKGGEAIVYGDYRNQLSITADDVVKVQAEAKK